MEWRVDRAKITVSLQIGTCFANARHRCITRGDRGERARLLGMLAAGGTPIDVWRWLVPALLVFAGVIVGQVLAAWTQSRLLRREWEARRRDGHLRKVQKAFDRCGEASSRARPFKRGDIPVPTDLLEEGRTHPDRMEALLARIGDKQLEQCWEVWEQTDIAFTIAARDDRDAWRATFRAVTAFHRRVGEVMRE
jgi:hypothetical protein